MERRQVEDGLKRGCVDHQRQEAERAADDPPHGLVAYAQDVEEPVGPGTVVHNERQIAKEQHGEGDGAGVVLGISAAAHPRIHRKNDT